LAVNTEIRIHRQDAKSAKNFAKQNSFQANNDFQLSSTGGKAVNELSVPVFLAKTSLLFL
jgi:hypothetical protein